MNVIKKIAVSLILMLLLAGVAFTLQNNKAKSEAKAKGVAQRPFAVSVAQVERKELASGLSLVGTIAPNREVALASETAGRVEAVSLSVGDYKPAGAVVVKVDDELKHTAVSMAEATYEKAKKDLERYQMVQTENAIPDQQIDLARWNVKSAETQLQTARRQLRDTRITAPFGGVVAARHVEIGSMVQPGMVVANLVDVSVLKVRLNVAEKEVISIREGDRVEITSDLYPGISYFGRVATIGAKGDEAHTYPVEIALPNNGAHPLKPGMFARVSFTSIPKRSALVVPRASIIGSIKDPKVYVVNNNVVKIREIMVGSEAGTDVEVLKGLLPGDAVVVSGHNNLRDGMQVEVVK